MRSHFALGAAIALAAVVVVGSASPQRGRPGSQEAGQRIVFVKGARFGPTEIGRPAIHLINADGTGESRVAGGDKEIGTPVWSPDGRRFAYHWRGNIYVANADGSPWRVITDAAWPDWSPDGKRLVLSRGGGLYVVRPDGSGARLLVSEGSLPSWSPDGTRIAFLRRGVLIFDLRDGSTRRLTESGFAGVERGTLAWSPDGDQLLFQDYERGNPLAGIYVVDVEGGEGRRLASGFMANRPWSPNGEWILFDTHVDRPPEERGIHVISPDGSRLRMLSTAPGFPFGWSPDGTRILIRSREGPSSHDDLHVMNADGSGKTRLTADRDLDGEAMWQPRPLVDLSISARGPRRVRVGRAATYRVRVSNQGEDVARNVALTVSLGRKVTLVRFSPRKACRTRGVRSCRLRDVAPRGFVEVAVVVRATRAGRFAATFSASFSGADRAPLDNHLLVRAKALGTRR